MKAPSPSTAELMQAADILPYEMVHVYNISNGERFETYAIEGAAEQRGHLSERRRGPEGGARAI